MKKPKKTKAVKAVKMWKAEGGSYAYPNKKCAQYFSGFQAPSVKPVVLVPADAASVESMIIQAAEGLHAHMLTNKEWSPYELSRAALAAIGIKGGAK